jgi:hypothetical protein
MREASGICAVGLRKGHQGVRDIDATRGGFVLRRMAFRLRRALLLACLLAGFLLLGGLAAGAAYAEPAGVAGPLHPADELAVPVAAPTTGPADTGHAARSADDGEDSASSSDDGLAGGSGPAPEGGSGDPARGEPADSARTGGGEWSVQDAPAEIDGADNPGTAPADVARAGEIVDGDTASVSELAARKAAAATGARAERAAGQVAAITESLVEAAESVGRQLDEPPAVVERTVDRAVRPVSRAVAPRVQPIAEPVRPLEPDVLTPLRSASARAAGPVTAPTRAVAGALTRTPWGGTAAPVGPAAPAVTAATAGVASTASGTLPPVRSRPAAIRPVAGVPLAPALPRSPSAGGDGHAPTFPQAVLGDLPAALLVIGALTTAAGSRQGSWWFSGIAVRPG